jgi:hypothetical protein
MSVAKMATKTIGLKTDQLSKVEGARVYWNPNAQSSGVTELMESCAFEINDQNYFKIVF